MKPGQFLSVTFSLTLSSALWTTATTPAQGGVYRGPGNVVPVGMVEKPAAARGRPAIPGPGADLSVWQYWWEFNKERFLYERRDRGPGAGIPTKDITEKILPALLKSIKDGVPAGIQAASLLALGKIGRRVDRKAGGKGGGKGGGRIDRPSLRKLFLAALANPDQLVRESAVLALGVAGMSEAMPDLEALILDSPRGRKLSGGGAVHPRTRAFACHAIGLIAHRSPDLPVKTWAFKTLRAILERDPKQTSPDIQVAAISGLSILNISKDKGVVGNRELLLNVLKGLDRVQEDAALTAAVRSHIPGAIARLIGRGHDKVHEKYKARLLEMLQDTTDNHLRRAAILALGQIAEPAEINDGDEPISEALRVCLTNRRDFQSILFSLIALGQIGGRQNRAVLLDRLANGNKSLIRPWAAMALGAMEFRRRRQDPRAKPDKEIGKLLLKQLEGIKNPNSRGAMAVALGMSRYQPAARRLATYSKKYEYMDEFCGYLCIGLALLGGQDAATRIRKILATSLRRPDRLRHAATAVGVLRDRAATPTLIKFMRLDSNLMGRLSAVAGALGTIDDPKAIPDLVEILLDARLPTLPRAFAAAALGGLADPDPLPFYWGIVDNLNYRAAVRTLVFQGRGLLERL